MRICHSRTWQSPLSGGPDVVKWKSCLPKQQHPSYSSPCVMMPFARRPIHQRWFDTSCLISFVLPGKSQGNFWFRYNVAVSVTKWLHGGASWAWEVDLVSPGFRSRDVGTQLEWICSCKAIGNNNGSHAEGWSNYFSVPLYLCTSLMRLLPGGLEMTVTQTSSGWFVASVCLYVNALWALTVYVLV